MLLFLLTTILLWCFWTVVLEKTLESPLDIREIKPVNPKENQSWIFIGRTDAEAEAPILWLPDTKNWLIWKDPDAGKDWRQEEKGMTEDEMVGWHYWCNGHGFEQTLGDGKGQGSLACCSPWGRKELDMTEWPNNTISLCLSNKVIRHLVELGSEAQCCYCWGLRPRCYNTVALAPPLDFQFLASSQKMASLALGDIQSVQWLNVSDSLWPHGLQHTRLWGTLGDNIIKRGTIMLLAKHRRIC